MVRSGNPELSPWLHNPATSPLHMVYAPLHTATAADGGDCAALRSVLKYQFREDIGDFRYMNTDS